jgi:hypothetical protein
MRYSLTLTAPAATITAAELDARRLAGVAIPYGEMGSTSAGRLAIQQGAIRLPADLRRVKLFREHGRTTPIGYALEADSTPDALTMSFHVGATPDGDLALLEAAEGIRDGLSVELHDVKIRDGVVVSADLVGVAQVAVPAFAGAVLTASQTPPETPAPDTDDDDDDDTDDEDTTYDAAPDDAADTPDPVPAASPDNPDPQPEGESDSRESENTVTPTVDASRPLPAAERTTTPAGPRTLLEFAATLAPVMTAAGEASTVNAALADIIPANTGDPGGAFLRPMWLGELWTPRRDDRHFVNVFSGPALTGMTWEGWKWDVTPVVGPYAGNKTDIPTSPASIVPATGAATRIAGGWDVDRIYEDFNSGFIAALLEAATHDYGQKSEAALAATLLAEATDAGTAASVPEAIATIASTLASVGASLSTLGMSADVFAAFLGLPLAEVPWWLTNQSVVTISGEGSSSVAGVVVDVVPSLPSGTMLGADRNAVDFRETGPFRVQAINIPKGGIDVAIFGYQGQIIHDARGIVKVAAPVPPPPAPPARSSDK